MNRLVTTNLAGVSPDRLPPLRREGPARLLFLTATFLGFGTYHRKLLAYGAERPDVDAVHVELRAPLWLKVIGKSLPGASSGWDFHAWRHLVLWRQVIRRWLRGPLSTRHFDAVHIITQGNALAVLDVAPDPHTAFAINIDGTAVQQVTEFGRPAWTVRPYLRAEQRMYERADAVVCRNRWCAGSLRDDFHLPEEKIVVARNSMKPPPACRQDHPPRSEDEPVRIVFVGNAFARKGGPQLLRLHQERWADRAELHVCSRQAVPDRSARNVIWHGATPHAKLLEELLPTMDLFVMPTSHDMHPWAILEAASIGLPVVSTRFAGIPEMVLDGETGFLTPVHDWDAFAVAVEKLLADRSLQEAFGRRAREHIIRNYDPDESYGGLFDRLVGLADGRRAGAG